MSFYQNKYLKYKMKYLDLKQSGGNLDGLTNDLKSLSPMNLDPNTIINIVGQHINDIIESIPLEKRKDILFIYLKIKNLLYHKKYEALNKIFADINYNSDIIPQLLIKVTTLHGGDVTLTNYNPDQTCMVCLDPFAQLYSHIPHGSSVNSIPDPHLICTKCLTILHNTGYTMCPLKCGVSINIDGTPIIRRPPIIRQAVQDINDNDRVVAQYEEPDILRSLFDGLNHIAPSTRRYTDPLLRVRQNVYENDRQIDRVVTGAVQAVTDRIIQHVNTSDITPSLLLVSLIYMINTYVTR